MVAPNLQLTHPGEFGVLERRRGRWGQVMRHPAGFVVEVHDGTPDDCAQRVYRGEPGDYPRPLGPRAAYPLELWAALPAAQLLWAWVRTGTLPDGCSRTMRHMVNRWNDHGLG